MNKEVENPQDNTDDKKTSKQTDKATPTEKEPAEPEATEEEEEPTEPEAIEEEPTEAEPTEEEEEPTEPEATEEEPAAEPEATEEPDEPEATEEEEEPTEAEATEEDTDEVEPDTTPNGPTYETPLESGENANPPLADGAEGGENTENNESQDQIATAAAATTATAGVSSTTNNYTNSSNLAAEPSSRRRRFFAHCLDSIILTILINIILRFLPSQSGTVYEVEMMTTVPFIVAILYFTLFPTSPLWATPGQKILGIYICKSKDFSKIGLLPSLARVLLFYLLSTLSFAIAAVIVVGTDIKQLEKSLTMGINHQKPMHLNGKMLYKKKPMLVSFYDQESKKKVHLLNVIGETNIIVEDSKHQLQLTNKGETVAQKYYDHKVSFNKQIKNINDDALKQYFDDALGVFWKMLSTILTLIAFTIYLYVMLLVVPTLLNRRKQTIYDKVFGVFVARKKTQN